MPEGGSWDLGWERRKDVGPRCKITWAGENARTGLPAHALVEFEVRQAKLGASCRVQVPVGRGIRMISRKG